MTPAVAAAARSVGARPATTAPLLAVEALTVRLARRIVLEGVDLEVRAGELVGLIGPNGAGKTTLLRAILGLLPADSGRVLVDGASPRRGRNRVGYVPQRHEFAWEFPISVRDAVMSGRTGAIGWLRRPGRADRDAIDEALARTGIEALARRPVGELSGGQRQRVLVARALALRPKLLLLDEPFTGVDIPTQGTLTALFERLRADGQAMLMTTHDIPSAMLSCTRLALLNRTIVACGTADELRDPATWLEAFGVGSSEQLAASLGVCR